MMKFVYKPSLRLLISATVILVAGCVNTDRSDLEQFVAEVLARPGGRIEPLPEIKPYKIYAYQSGEAGTRDPFHLFYQSIPEEVVQTEDDGLTKEMEKEIMHRNREELEEFELDSLRMVGTLEDSEDNWGIIQSPDGNVHRVKVGNYLGRNIGKILNIFEDSIELREIIKTPQGRWEEREASIALAEK